MYDNKSNRDLLEEFDIYVKGHTEAKKALINLVSRSKIRYYQKHKHLEDQYHLLEPGKLMLLGPTGTGKTYLVETMVRLAGCPFVRFDATTLAPSSTSKGINQDSMQEMIAENAEKLVDTQEHYRSRQGIIDQTIVLIDEIDKLTQPSDSTGNWNKHVQESFLTVFDDRCSSFAGVSYIFAGAFTGIKNQLTIHAKNIGFHSQSVATQEVDWEEEVIKYGIIPELMGRIRGGVVALDELTEPDYRYILESILIPKKEDELLYFNQVGLALNATEIDAMVEKALKSGQGIRSLKRELDKRTADLEFYYEDVVAEQALLENMMDRYGSQSD